MKNTEKQSKETPTTGNKTNKIGFIVGAAIVVVCAIAVVAVIFYYRGKNAKQESVTSNPTVSANEGKYIPTKTSTMAMTDAPIVNKAETFEGLWIENSGEPKVENGIATAAAAVLFRDGRAYFGIYGESTEDIFNGVSGAGIP